jgi:hypothetical protein
MKNVFDKMFTKSMQLMLKSNEEHSGHSKYF